jgi:ATP-dependent RNA helicase DeaD
MNTQNSLFSGNFEDFDLTEGLLKGLERLGYKQPTHVQSAVFKHVSSGSDLVVQSHTGSGKTTAFGLPILNQLDAEDRSVQAICLAPTRELALQVATEIDRLAHDTDLVVAPIYGGASIRGQIDALKHGVHFVVGTPGRVMDLMERGVLKLNKARFAVLDEADEMLSMGFWEDVTSILRKLPKDRNTLLFSATLPDAIERAARTYLDTPQRVELSGDGIAAKSVRHVYHEQNEEWAKPRNLLYLLEYHKPEAAIVFCNRKDETTMVAKYLKRFGYRTVSLNGDMSQKEREKALALVRNNDLDLLISTDIAARGIDISHLPFVFNYDLPDFDEVYVHRCGRTGRIGRKGTAVSLIRGRYMSNLSAIQKNFQVEMEKLSLPPEKEIIWMQANRLAEQLLEAANGVETSQYREVAEALEERGDTKEVLAFLLKSHFGKPAASSSSSAEKNEKPQRKRAPREDRPQREDAPEEDVEADSPFANLYISLGKDNGINDITELMNALAEIAGVDPALFNGAGHLRDHSSHIEVDKEVAETIKEKVNGAGYPEKFGSEKLEDDAVMVCDLARPRRKRPPQRRGPRNRR